jgi:hypothetical protein
MVKQQHYVPRFYLKSFANPKGQIWVYDKSGDKVFLSKVEGVASEKFFYDTEKLDKAVGQDQFIEKALSVLEGQAATVFGELLGKLNGNRFTRLHPNERYFLAHFIAVQMLRTRKHRIQIQQMSDKMSAWVHSFLPEEVKAASPEQVPPLKVSESQLAELQGMSLSDPEVLTKHADILGSHFWIILRAVPGKTFLTSDHPVGKKANIHKPFRSMSGTASKGIEIVFPLSPNYSVCLHERTHFEKQLQRFKSFEDRVHELNDTANMDYYNHLQIMRSNRFLFGITDDFAFAKATCAEEPHWRDQSRRPVASNKDSEERTT